jgi:putative ABC transport system permease protein
VFLAGLGFALFFGAASGVYPAWRMSRLNPVEALKGTPR